MKEANGVDATEAALCRCFSKQEFLKTLQYSQENTCDASLFNKAAGLRMCNFIKYIAKYLEIAFSQSTPALLLLILVSW